MNPRRARATAAAVTALVLALAAGGCSGSDDELDPDGGPAAPDSTAEAPLVETTAKIGAVAGSKLPDARRDALKDQVKPVVDAWVDGAYVGGSWPRTAVGDAFAGFTTGARQDAERDLDVLSNADIGDRVTAVTATRRELFLDVLAVKRRPVAVTARLLLRFETAGDVARTETVRARLFLTRGADGWQVFGYDVSAGDGAAGTGQQGTKDTQDKKDDKGKQKGSRR